MIILAVDEIIYVMCEKIKLKLQTGKRKDLDAALDMTDALIDLVKAVAELRDKG